MEAFSTGWPLLPNTFPVTVFWEKATAETKNEANNKIRLAQMNHFNMAKFLIQQFLVSKKIV
jgi:hypothetical protein